jgi:hypothetical protein
MASLTNTKIKNTYVSLLKVADNGQLDAALQDITDGAGNVTGVQLNTGGDLAASGTISFGSLKDTGENITIAKFVDAADGIGSNNNDTSIPTSAAVSAYVASQITLEDLDFTGDSGTGAVDLNSQTLNIIGTANEITTAAGAQTLTIGLPSTINVNVTGDLTGNVTGNLTGTVLTAAQPNITSVGTLTGLTTTGNINFGDDDRAVFGAGSDLQIYHDGNDSYITNTTGGNFFINDDGAGYLMMKGSDLYFRNPSNVDIIHAQSGGFVKLYYNGVAKLATTSTGIDVTGTVTANGLTGNVTGDLTGTVLTAAQTNITSVGTLSSLAVSGNLTVDTNTLFVDAANNRVGVNITPTAQFHLGGTDSTKSYIDRASSTRLQIFQSNDGQSHIGSSGSNAALILRTGTTFGTDTERMRIDASGRVGIGTAAIGTNDKLLIKTSVDNSVAQGLVIQRSANTDEGYINYNGGAFQFRSTDGDPIVVGQVSNERMRIDSSGNVGIGTASAASSTWSRFLQIEGVYAGLVYNSTAGDSPFKFSTGVDDNVYIFRDETNSATRMAIDSSGRVGIGTSSPAYALDVAGDIRSSQRLWLSGIDGLSISGSDLRMGFTNSTIQFRTNSGERMRIDSSGYLRLAGAGIQFNGDTAAANALDDYEEGTWTPVYVPTTGSFATMTMNTLTAKYTKIGNMVTVYAVIRTSDVDVTGGSGDVRIGGLPFTVSAFGGGIALGLTSNFTNAPDGGHFFNATTQITLRKTNVSTGLVVADLSNGTNTNHNGLYFTGTYLI